MIRNFQLAILMGFAAFPAMATAEPGAQTEIGSPETGLNGGRTHSHLHSAGEIDEVQGAFIVEVTYAADVISVVDGGIARGTRYLDNLDLVAEAGLEQLIGWKGASTKLYALYNNGGSVGSLVGDAQGVSNIEAETRAIRIYEAWIEQQITERASVLVGLYDLNSEFDVVDSGGLFLNGAHGIGTDIGQTGRNGPSIFPYTSLAARVAVETGNGWTIRAAVLDGVPADPNRPKRTAVLLKEADGALLIGEIELPISSGKVLAGYWNYTSKFETFAGEDARGNRGWYLRGEQRILSEASDPDQGLTGFVRVGTADGDFNSFSRYFGTGLAWRGLVSGRDQDEAGVALASAFSSDGYRALTGASDAEIAVEATYRAQISNWLSIQPNLQYVINPGADPNIDNALIFGIRFELGSRIFGE